MKQEFDWGGIDESFYNTVNREIFEDKIYESFFTVKPGDVVLDLGASIGPFTWSIMDKASKVISVEPSIELIPLLTKNTSGYPVSIVNKALTNQDGNEVLDEIYDPFKRTLWGVSKEVQTTTFKSIIKEHNLDRIDFIKTDCEGGEYALFTDDNMDFLLNKVRNIVGEWHLCSPQHEIEFRNFRDKYLPQFKQFEVRSLDGVDIKWDLGNEHFLEYYTEVIIHINNE
tara:strand:- start:486 stop:1166 length:681 start_codon:yes stop_codon:yes gene_type:complete